jgi:hypothetical protein
VVKLSAALPDPIAGRQPAPPRPPTLIDGQEDYTVKKILNSRMRYNRLEYLVKWKGYNNSYNSWEVHRNFQKEKVAKFHRNNPGAARHINAAIFDSIPFTQAELATSWRSSCVVTLRL